MRSSEAFQLDWVKFVQESVKRTPSPVFFQYVTHEVFKCLIKEEYPVPDHDGNKNGESKEITREEENALRYVVGYACRKVCSKIQSSSLENKDDLIICVNDMCSREVNEDGTEDWLNAIDRGGLWHVNDQTYNLFYNLEYLVRMYFAVHTHTAGSKQALTAILESNEDVLYIPVVYDNSN